jgi:hypothetical protein
VIPGRFSYDIRRYAFSSLTVLRVIDGVAWPLELKTATAVYIRSSLAMTNQFPVLHRFKCLAVRFTVAAAAPILVGLLTTSAEAVSLVSYASFGGGDGWLSPGEGGYGFLATGNNERGLAYGNGHLYLVSRTGGNSIRILDSTSGSELGSLDITGLAGGTFLVDMAAVGGDGKIYVANLQGNTNTTTNFYKVYSWATEGSTPVVAYSGDSGLTGARIGDSLAVIGSGSSTRLAAGYFQTPVVAGNNGYSIIDPTAGTATAVAFSGTPPNAGDFKLGITFTDSSHVIGGPTSVYRYSSFSGTSGTLLASPTLTHPGGSTAERLLAYTVLGSHAYVAVQSTGDSHVSIYDATDPTNPIYLIDGNTTSGTLTANGNGTGEVAWGPSTLNGDGSYSQVLYAMSTNQGIQAFTFNTATPGDFNRDGLVDAGDYVTWNKNNTTNNALANDNGLGVPISTSHYDLWRANFGNRGPAGPAGSGASLGSSAVPEPCTMLIASFVVGGCLPFVRKR